MSRIIQFLYVCYAISIFILTFSVIFPAFLFTNLIHEKKFEYQYRLIQVWSKTFFKLLGMSVMITGKEHISKNRQYVVVANHRSFLDIPLIYCTLNMALKPLARSDFGRIPLFGFIYRQMTLLVDRSNDASKHKSMVLMFQTIQFQKISLFVFPEGSFNETEKHLKGFYNGAFKVAKDTGTSILPVIFPDTKYRWSYKSFWSWSPGKCRAIILEPIDVEEIAETDLLTLKSKVKEKMRTALIAAESK